MVVVMVASSWCICYVRLFVPVCHYGYKIVLVNTLEHIFLNRKFKKQVKFMKDGKLNGS
jgi:hypothetical protein